MVAVLAGLKRRVLARITNPAAVAREATWAALVLPRFGVLGRGSGKTSL